MDDKTFGQKVNSRKFALACGVISVATALVVGGYITGDNWVNIATVITGAYMAAQAWLDHRSKK